MMDKTDRLLPEATALVENMATLMCLPAGSLEVTRGSIMLYGTSRNYMAHGIAVHGDEKQAVSAAVLALYQWAKANGHLGRKCLWTDTERSQGSPRNPPNVQGPLDYTPDRKYRAMVQLVIRR